MRSTSRLALHAIFLTLIMVVMSMLQSRSAYGAPISVDTSDDEYNSDGDYSLREAITAANTNTDVAACPAGEDDTTDTITLAEGTFYSLILDGRSEDAAATGDLDIINNTADVDLIINVDGTTVSAKLVEDKPQ